MSSDRKDARWGLANRYAAISGLTYDDFTYPQWQALLDAAQCVLDVDPHQVLGWAKEFRGE